MLMIFVDAENGSNCNLLCVFFPHSLFRLAFHFVSSNAIFKVQLYEKSILVMEMSDYLLFYFFYFWNEAHSYEEVIYL